MAPAQIVPLTLTVQETSLFVNWATRLPDNLV